MDNYILKYSYLLNTYNRYKKGRYNELFLAVILKQLRRELYILMKKVDISLTDPKVSVNNKKYKIVFYKLNNKFSDFYLTINFVTKYNTSTFPIKRYIDKLSTIKVDYYIDTVTYSKVNLKFYIHQFMIFFVKYIRCLLIFYIKFKRYNIVELIIQKYNYFNNISSVTLKEDIKINILRLNFIIKKYFIIKNNIQKFTYFNNYDNDLKAISFQIIYYFNKSDAIFNNVIKELFIYAVQNYYININNKKINNGYVILYFINIILTIISKNQQFVDFYKHLFNNFVYNNLNIYLEYNQFTYIITTCYSDIYNSLYNKYIFNKKKINHRLNDHYNKINNKYNYLGIKQNNDKNIIIKSKLNIANKDNNLNLQNNLYNKKSCSVSTLNIKQSFKSKDFNNKQSFFTNHRKSLSNIKQNSRAFIKNSFKPGLVSSTTYFNNSIEYNKMLSTQKHNIIDEFDLNNSSSKHQYLFKGFNLKYTKQKFKKKNKEDNNMKLFFETEINNRLKNKFKSINFLKGEVIYKDKMEAYDKLEFKKGKKILNLRNKGNASSYVDNEECLNMNYLYNLIASLNHSNIKINGNNEYLIDKNLLAVHNVNAESISSKNKLKNIILNNNNFFNLAEVIYRIKRKIKENPLLKNKYIKKYNFNKKYEYFKLKVNLEKEIGKWEKIINTRQSTVNKKCNKGSIIIKNKNNLANNLINIK